MTLTEKDLCKQAVAWFQSHGCEVYQEVAPYGGNRADIVATQGKIVTVCEAKLSTSLALLGQAYYWTRYAHMVWVATPSTRLKKTHWNSSRAFEAFLKAYGIGWVEFGDSAPRVCVQAQLRRRIMKGVILERLRPEMKLIEAGGNRGGHWTPYRETCNTVRRFVESHPGCQIKDVISELGKLHYASINGAKVGLRDNLKKGVLHGVRLAADGVTLELDT